MRIRETVFVSVIVLCESAFSAQVTCPALAVNDEMDTKGIIVTKRAKQSSDTWGALGRKFERILIVMPENKDRDAVISGWTNNRNHLLDPGIESPVVEVSLVAKCMCTRSHS